MMSPVRRISEIVIWSSISNLILLGCFVMGWNTEAVRNALGVGQPWPSAEQRAADPLALPNPVRGGNEILIPGPQRQLKGALQVTVVAQKNTELAEDEAEVAEAPLEDVPPAGEGYSDPEEVGPEGRGAQTMRPVLRAGRRAGDLEIGNFETVSLSGGATECLGVGYGLLNDVGAPRDQLKVLADTSSIILARICAANGAVVITCRSDQITISPRRLKPSETCTG